MGAFVIVHVYLTTTGSPIYAYHKAMITGWEEPHGGGIPHATQATQAAPKTPAE